MAKFRIPALLFLIAPVFGAAALMSLAPGGRAGAAADPGTGAIADAEGALRVPADYRSIVSIFGDLGDRRRSRPGIEAAPLGLCLARRGRRLSGEWPLPGRSRSGEGGLRDRHRPHDDWHGQPCGHAGGLVRHGQRQQEQPSAKQALGQRMGLVMVRRQDPLKTTSTDYKTDCQPCHIPAQATDWIYTQGYPILRK